jgi:hypothetical protein
VDDSLTRNYLVFLLLMLGLVILVALLVLGLRPIFDRLMNAAFDKLGLKETIAGVSLPPETHSDSESATPEIRVFDSLADLPHRTGE